jgi:putative ABC transport system permease protein
MNNQDLGYAKDRVITMPYYGEELANSYDAFYNELVKNTAIKNVGRSSRVPTGRLLDSQGAQIQEGDSLVSTDITIKNVRVDHAFFDTYSIPINSGRNFSKEIKSDDSLAFILNESAVKMIGWTNGDAIGKVLQYGGVKGQVIGVVNDFHFESLHEPIVPLVFHIAPSYNDVSVAVAGDDLQTGLAYVEDLWKQFLPERPFEYSFLSEQYKELYDSEQKQSQLFVVFSGLAIFIASLGLFGLATFNTLQRIKEIGIRKVLGASIPSILTLLSKEIVTLIIIANLIAWPAAWYFMNEWLDGFAYHVTMNFGIYILAAFVAIAIALVTVSTQTIRAAMTNPASTLRSE